MKGNIVQNAVDQKLLKIQIWVTDSVCFIEKYDHRMSEIKQELYDKAGIGIPHLDSECNDVAIFG